jgi:hypothetical protein
MKMEMKQMQYDFDDNIFSDLHKDAYGFRPRGHEYYEALPARKQEIWVKVCEDLEAALAEEARMEEEALADFKAQITKVIEAGAGNRINALRWMTSTETFYHSQDVEHWVYNQGILFTDYGRELVKELESIVEYSFDWE